MEDISSVYVTTQRDRREQVALIIGEQRKPVWINDPARLVLQRWEAETGLQAGSFGAAGCSVKLPAGRRHRGS